MHIFKRNSSYWEADHGFYGTYSGWDFNKAATKNGQHLDSYSFWPFQDNRTQKQYIGISIDLSKFKGVSKDEFLTKIMELVNKVLQ